MHFCLASKEEFLEAFLTDQSPYSPFNSHILEFWKIRDEPNILFLFYEDMKRDLDSVLKKTAQFLGKSYTQGQFDELCIHLSFDKMKNNSSVNKEKEVETLRQSVGLDYSRDQFSFIRQGKVGSYNKELSEEYNKKFDAFSKHPDFEKYEFAHKFC